MTARVTEPIEYGDWDEALDKLVARFVAGAWRHGLTTKAALQEVKRYGKFPSNLNTMWDVKYRKKNGNLAERHLGYYLVQHKLHTVRFLLEGASGKKLRPRLIHNVEHGVGEGETDEQGRPVRPSKEGLWLYKGHLSDLDVVKIRAAYRGRADDSHPDKWYLDRAHYHLDGLPADTVVDDIHDLIVKDL